MKILIQNPYAMFLRSLVCLSKINITLSLIGLKIDKVSINGRTIAEKITVTQLLRLGLFRNCQKG